MHRPCTHTKNLRTHPGSGVARPNSVHRVQHPSSPPRIQLNLTLPWGAIFLSLWCPVCTATDLLSCLRNIWNAPNGARRASAMEINLLIRLILPNWPFLSGELVGSKVFPFSWQLQCSLAQWFALRFPQPNHHYRYCHIHKF